jgi:hypothetical protein
MTAINLTNGYLIEVDDLNYTLKQRYIGEDKDGNPKEAERVCGYFGKDLDSAVRKYLRLNQNALMDQEAMEMEEYMKKIHEINNEAVKAIKSVIEGRR